MIQVKGYYYEEAGQRYTMTPKVMAETLRGNGGKIGRTLYPIFERPSQADVNAGRTRVAVWRITPDGCRVVRWYWQVREHTKGHSGCCALGDGLCGFKMVRYANWNAEAGKWELEPIENRATPEQERVLDSK